MSRIGDMMKKGLFAPIKALLPKNPWLRVLVYALPFVLLLALFGPALDVVLKLVDLVVRVLEPMLQTTIGRVLLLMVVIAVLGMVAFLLLRGRVQEWRGEAVLGRHLKATAMLVGIERRKSKDGYRRVARYRGPEPRRYPHVVADADLKLARQALDDGHVDEALGWLQRIVEPGLPKELVRSLLQLRLRCLQRQGEVLPATLRREAEQACKRFPEDVRMLAVLRDLAEQEQRHDDALDYQERIQKHAPRAIRLAERQRYVDLLVVAGERALSGDDLDGAKKVVKRLQRAEPDGSSHQLLQGDLHRRLGEWLKAVRAYGAAQSPLGLDRLAEMLSEHPGVIEPRELLTSCPMQGTLLLVARELARRGEHARAERAARVAAEVLGPTPTVCAVLAEVLDLLGESQRAQLLREQTVARLLAAP